MGNLRADYMYKWLEADRPQRQKDYMAYLKAAVNVDEFVDAGTLDSFFAWCMDNQPDTGK